MSDEVRPPLLQPSALNAHPTHVAAVLLAAGRSRRMGAFKPLLPFGERTVAQACVEHLLAGGVSEIVVVAGHRAAELRAALAQMPVSFALNEMAESEMGVSIARGVERVSEQASAVLVALVDQPAVAPETVREILDARLRTLARLIIPVWEGRGGHPVLVDLAFRAELLALDAARGLRALFDARRSEVLRLPVSSPFVARDMDTWDDYRALHREVFGTLPEVERPENAI
ncbi:MAG TPA: nucleotidyltransferase family protein [Pyrinomonadaceae bacterium]|nr:nucleotidyltransferase family protein [Pyrinomonadaceae bacterium]